MAAESSPFRYKRFFRLLFITVAVLAVIIVGLHLWFVHNAKGVLKTIIAERSGGKLRMELSQVSFNLLTNNLQVAEADLISTDSIDVPTTYHIQFRKLSLHVGSFWPLLVNKQLILDSILLQQPVISVTQWQKDTSQKIARDELSIPKEMGKMYNSLLDVLDDFGIRRVKINNASLSLINKIKPGVEPITMSRIYFDLVRTATGLKKRDEFVANEHSVDLKTTDQKINLPGGRHALSFKKFNLELFRKRIQLDSCTITAIATGNSKSSYKIFFNKLILVGVDFNAMYRFNLIRADSVYCENPLFDINLVQSDAVAKKKERPDPEKIIRDLTGDLDLAFVGVKDAGIHINISGGKRERSLFNSNNDDFEMRGLRINSDSSKPVSVDRFDMLVRNYHLYNEDSSSAYTFDSIHFANNRIILNNFKVETNSTSSKSRDIKNFSIPYFELTGIDWYELIFEQKMVASSAVMQRPVIYYTSGIKQKRKRTNLFTSLNDVAELMTLDRVSIYNGEMHLKLGKDHSFDLKNVDLSIHSNRLLHSTSKEGIRRAVELLSFSEGVIRLKDITARLNNVRFTGRNLLHADKVSITSKGKTVEGTINDIYIDNLMADDQGNNIVINGLRWSNADIVLNTSPGKKKEDDANLQLKNIRGANSKIRYSNGQTSVSTYLTSVNASSISKTANSPVQIEGLLVNGSSFNVSGQGMKASGKGYSVSTGSSFVNNLLFEKYSKTDSVYFKTSRLNFSADINSMVNGHMELPGVEAYHPIVRIKKQQQPDSARKESKTNIYIGKLSLSEPDVVVRLLKNDSATSIFIPPSSNSSIDATGISIAGSNISIDGFKMDGNSATLIKANGEIMGVDKGKVQVNINDIKSGRKENIPYWSASIHSIYLDNPRSMVMGKNRSNLMVERASFGNINLSSEYLSNTEKLVRNNISAWLKTATGSLSDSISTFKWYNAEYDYSRRSLKLDSFVYYPTQPKDSVLKYAEYQADYITLKTGMVEMLNFDLENYKQDSSLIADRININSPEITIYRDKQPPFLGGVVKPLPVDMIKKIVLPVSINRVNIIDGNLAYTERNAKSRAEGTLTLSHITGNLSNIRNRFLSENDSLTLNISGYLMDSALVQLRVKESYQDSAGGFLMTLKMRPTSLAFLNPVVAPLSNVIIRSGTIDSLELRAVGNDKVAFGKMQMFYHDLRIRLVKDGNPDKTTFMGNVATFLANAILIRKNNNGKTGLVYFERLRDRSFFNYIVKTTFSGMATSIGVKKNRKYLKQYRRLIQEKDLPVTIAD